MDLDEPPPRIDISKWNDFFATNIDADDDDASIFFLNKIRALIKHEQQSPNDRLLLLTSPVDVLLWQLDDSQFPFASQLGGTPFVEPGFSWPTTRGEKLYFLGNIYFGDSTDLVPNNLPGDVLNIFLVQDDLIYLDYYAIEWSTSIKGKRLASNIVPSQSCELISVQGRMHRTHLGYGLRGEEDNPSFEEKVRRRHQRHDNWRNALASIPEFFTGICNRCAYLEQINYLFPEVDYDRGDLIAVVSPFSPSGRWPLLDQAEEFDEPIFEHGFHETAHQLFVFHNRDGKTSIALRPN